MQLLRSLSGRFPLADAWSKKELHAEPKPARVVKPAALTHHQIVELVAPFVLGGRELDLDASDRAARRLAFRPVSHGPAQDRPPDASTCGMTETMELSSPRPGFHRLVRRLRLDDDPLGRIEATLQADGARPDALLAGVQAVPPWSQFRFGPGWRLALQQRLQGAQSGLTGAVLQMAGWTLALRIPATRTGFHVSAAIDLRPDDGIAPNLPDDLMAVLGWDWSALTRSPHGRAWTASLRLRGTGPARSRDALRQLSRAAGHLVRTLAEPPWCFHDRLAAARHRVWLRRTLPWAAAGLLAVQAVFAGEMKEARDSLAVVALLLLPVVLMAIYLWRSEQPRLEWPC